jgi:hypothetical protein
MFALRRTLCRPVKLTNFRVKQLESILERKKENPPLFLSHLKETDCGIFQVLFLQPPERSEFCGFHCDVILLKEACIVLPIVRVTPGANLCT